jgi:hypothetical protein
MIIDEKDIDFVRHVIGSTPVERCIPILNQKPVKSSKTRVWWRSRPASWWKNPGASGKKKTGENPRSC